VADDVELHVRVVAGPLTHVCNNPTFQAHRCVPVHPVQLASLGRLVPHPQQRHCARNARWESTLQNQAPKCARTAVPAQFLRHKVCRRFLQSAQCRARSHESPAARPRCLCVILSLSLHKHMHACLHYRCNDAHKSACKWKYMHTHAYVHVFVCMLTSICLHLCRCVDVHHVRGGKVF